MSSSPAPSRTDGIEKVGAAIVRGGKVLVVRKQRQPTGEFFMAGGKMEPGESHLAALARELHEELGVTMTSARFLGSFRDIAVFESVPIVIHAYHVEVSGEPQPNSEITELCWLGRTDMRKTAVSSIMAHHVMPALERAELI